MGGSRSTVTNQTEKLNALDIQSSAYGISLPVVYGRTKIAGNLLWFGNFRSHEHRDKQSSGGKGGGGGVTTVNIWYTYTVSAMLALCEGVVSAVNKVWKGDSVFDSLAKLNLSLASGAIGQAIWQTVQSVAPNEAVPYSGIAYICGTDYDLGESAQMENHQFEISAKLAYSINNTTPDANPASILTDLLTSTRYGASFQSSRLDFTKWSQYCLAAGVLMSPAFTEQQSAADIISKFAALTDSEPVWNDGKLSLIPRCEEQIVGTLGTYTPNSTPVYNLTDDDFVANDEGAVRVEITPQADAKNSVSIEYTNRTNNYVTEVSDAKDQADIDTSSERAADSVDAKWICEPSIARKVSQQLLQRSLYIRKTYSFSLPWTFALLSPMDIVTITDSALGLSNEPVRIVSISENDDGCIDIEAEELLYGVSNAATYSQQSGAGFVHDFGVDPGSIEAPRFAESPVSWTETGLEICVAARGKNANWGGCDVHYSVDGGSSYKKLGQIKFGSLYGRVISISGSTATVEIVSGTMPSASTQDATAKDIVAWIGGTNPEYVAIGGITPLATENQYLLSNLNRGVWGTIETAHPSDVDFILMDSQVVRTGSIDRGLVNSTVYFKFCSFNVYGAEVQTLETATAYPYQIKGSILMMPPYELVSGLTAEFESKGVLLTWNASTEPDVKHYQVKYGNLSSTWANATDIGVVDATYTRIELGSGSYKLYVAPVDDYGNVGNPSSTTLSVVQPSVCREVYADVVDNNVMLYWTEPTSSSYPVSEYQVRRGTSWELGDPIGTNGNSTFTAIVERSGGEKTYWLRAVDMCGNLGDVVSINVNVNAPADYVLYSDVDFGLYSGAGVFTNVLFENGNAIAPVNLTETWAEHYTNNGYTSPQDQIDAGFPVYAQPGSNSATMTWEHDFGTQLPSSSLSVTAQYECLSLGASVSLRFYTKAQAADEWTEQSGTSVFLVGIRFVKVVVSVTNGIAVVRNVNLKADVQQIQDAGSARAISTDTLGTTVPFNVSFTDVQTIQLQAKGTVQATMVLNFDDVPHPTGFKALAYDRNGNRISCDFSWVARGIK